MSHKRKKKMFRKNNFSNSFFHYDVTLDLKIINFFFPIIAHLLEMSASVLPIASNLRALVALPDREDSNEWLASHSTPLQITSHFI